MRRTAAIALGGAVALAAAAWATSAAVPAAQAEAAWAALGRGDHAAARPTLEALARDGDARAQDALATMHLRGLGVARSTREAMKWYCRVVHHPAGGQGVMHAAWFLAEFFRTGGGVPGPRYGDGRRGDEDPIRAYFWFTVMARQAALFERRHADSERLGEIGRGAVGRNLYDDEKAAVDAAVDAWRPSREVPSGEACLALPDGLDA